MQAHAVGVCRRSRDEQREVAREGRNRRGGARIRLAEPIIRVESLAQQVYRHLKEEILRGAFAPGERVVETKIAAALQVSRGPVREALRQLVAEQLLHEDRGVIITFVPTYESFRELYQLRVAIESMAAELAAEVWTPERAEAFEGNLQRSRHAMDHRDSAALVEHNTEFHRLILELSGNTRFQHAISSVSVLLQGYWHQVARAVEWPSDMVTEHTRIYNAVRAGDGVEAASAMRRHIERDLEVMAKAYRK